MVGGLSGLLLVADGLDTPLFYEMLGKGQLPEISRHIYERVLVTAKNALCGHPASTLEQNQSLYTMRPAFDPGSTYVRNGHIVDRLRRAIMDKGDCAGRQTIFHALYDPERETVSIFNPFNDGATHKHPFIISTATLNFARGYFHGSNHAALSRFFMCLDEIKPGFTGIWLHEFDRKMHYGTIEEVKESLRALDWFVGKLARRLEKRRVDDSYVIALVSDHSNAEAIRHSPNRICREAGFAPKHWSTRNNAGSIVTAYGYGVGQIYLLKEPKFIQDNIARLLESPAVEHVIMPVEDGRRIVFSKNSTVEIEMEERLIREGDIEKKVKYYRMGIVDGEKPFGYSKKLCDELATPHTSRQSLKWTCEQEEPDAVVGIAESMWHPRSPNLRFLAAPGHSFPLVRNMLYPETGFNSPIRRSHGTLHRAESEIVFAIAGPREFTPVQANAARIIDMGPTLIKILGRKVPEGIDGVSLV